MRAFNHSAPSLRGQSRPDSISPHKRCPPRTSSSSNDATGSPPWTVLFDLRERETIWTNDNKARLVKIVAKKKLDIPLDELQQRLDTILLLLPDLEERVAVMHPDQLAALLKDPGHVGDAVIQLRALLPLCNVSGLVSLAPHLLHPPTLERLPAELAKVHELLRVKAPGQGDAGAVDSAERFAAAVQEQPLLLDSECVAEALGELARLFPARTNVRHMLLRDPAYLLRVQRGQNRIGVHPDSFPDASYLDVQSPRHTQSPRWQS